MPYIADEQRAAIAPLLDAVILAFDDFPADPLVDAVGYAVYRIVNETLGKSGWRYRTLARAVAVFECAALEIDRRRHVQKTREWYALRDARNVERAHPKIVPPVDALIAELKRVLDDQVDGLLNYICTRLSLGVLYSNESAYALLIACKELFYDSVVGSYEDTAKSANGDIPEYAT